MTETRVTVFGLGEAGSEIAGDLAAAGAEVHGFDPADVPTPPSVSRHADPAAALLRPHLVLGITTAADARTALTQAYEAIPRGTVYADLATGPADLKQDLEEIAALRGVLFADVALMSTVPGKGIGTPSIVSGPGASRYVELVQPLGANVEKIGEEAGEAATRKLLRSVAMKGLAAAVIEAMQGAHQAGQAEWLWRHLADQLSSGDEALVRRLVVGTGKHAHRRALEMEAAAAMLERLEVEPVITRATAESLWKAENDGVPDIPE